MLDKARDLALAAFVPAMCVLHMVINEATGWDAAITGSVFVVYVVIMRHAYTRRRSMKD